MSSDRVVLTKQRPARAEPLPRHCSNRETTIREHPAPVDTLVFRGAATAIGEFRCPVDHPAFSDSGPILQPIVVFPRTSVWIRHEGSTSFVADPTLVTIYNRAQRYERRAISPDGDRCDWFGVSDELAREIASAFEPAAADRETTTFRFESARSTPALYLRQRQLLRRVASRMTDSLDVEERIVGIVSQVMALAYERAPRPLARRAPAARRRQEIVEHAKAELLRTQHVNRSVTDIARAVGTSVFHLCRVFRAQTGQTMHAYRTELRLRAALELVADDRIGGSLSAVAHELGFASHSHLVRLFRRRWGETPRAVRELLLSSAAVRGGHRTDRAQASKFSEQEFDTRTRRG